MTMIVQGIEGMGELPEGQGARAEVTVSSVDPSAFLPLERQARRLQLLAACAVGFVAIVPALVFLFLSLNELRSDAVHHGRHLAPTIVALGGGASPHVGSLSRWLGEEMVANDLSSVRLLDERGREILVLGERRRGIGATEAGVQLDASGGPVREIRIETADRGLYRRVGWVLGIHLVVAALLAALVYRVPMRALSGALDEVKRAQARLVHSEKLGAIGGMYAALTHEINNPLGIILTRVRLLLASAQEREFPAELIHDLEVIDHHGSRIADIARSLLAFARKTDLALVATDVNAVVGELVALVQGPFAKQGVHVQVSPEVPLPRVLASPDHLHQALLNIVVNARDAMPEGGTLALRTFANRRNVVVEVRDTGRGIPTELQPRVFEPFFTTKDVGKGTGLGLSVSYGIVRAHGGDIALESAPGNGTTFRVTLPMDATRR